MPPSANLVAVLCKHVRAGSWIVQQSQRVVPYVRECVEKGRIELHSEADSAHDFNVQVVAGFEEVLHGGGKDWIVWPVVGVPGLIVAADLEGLFEVGVDAAESSDEGRVGELGYFFAAVGDVAAVGLGGGLGRVSWC